MGSRWLFAVFLFLLVFLVVGLNWCWKYETVTSTNGQPIDNRLLVDSSTVAVDGSSASPIYEFPSIYRGGVPFRYYRALVFVDAPTIAYFSWLALVGDVCIASVIGLAASIYLWRTRFSLPAAVQIRGVRLSDIFVLTALMATGLAYWQYLRSEVATSTRLSQRVAIQQGIVQRAVRFPKPIAAYVPSFLHPFFMHCVSIEVNNPDDAMLSEIMQQPFVEELILNGGLYDLPKLPWLNSLHIRRPIHTETFLELCKCRGLQQLALYNSELDSLSPVDNLKCLRL